MPYHSLCEVFLISCHSSFFCDPHLASINCTSIDSVHMVTIARVVLFWSKQNVYMRVFIPFFSPWVVQIAQCFLAVKFKAQGREAYQRLALTSRQVNEMFWARLWRRRFDSSMTMVFRHACNIEYWTIEPKEKNRSYIYLCFVLHSPSSSQSPSPSPLTIIFSPLYTFPPSPQFSKQKSPHGSTHS